MRQIGPKCRLCRREGVKLFLKGEKCESPKCPITKRATPPGGARKFFYKPSEYSKQLREKQKAKRIFGLSEKQFHLTYEAAARKDGPTGELFLQFLERRLDNVIYRSGLAESRQQARQLVAHGHFLINDQRVTIPSITVRSGDQVTIRSQSAVNGFFKEKLAKKKPDVNSSWLMVDGKKGIVDIKELPGADECESGIDTRLIIEFYSR